MITQTEGRPNRVVLAEPGFIPVGGEGAQLGESPFWDHADCIWWVDIEGRQLLATRLSSHETRSWPTPELPGFVVLLGPEQPVVGMESGIFAFTPGDGTFRRMVAFSGAGQRFNDATVDGYGRLWASTMAIDSRERRGCVHAVTPGMELRTVLDGLATPNGLAADPAGGRLYFSDSHPDIRMIWHAPCDFTAGELGPRCEFASTDGLAGRPDGAALAADGGTYWIAGVDGSALYGFGRDGQLMHMVDLPFSAPTKLAFFRNGVAVTAKRLGGHDGRISIATDVPPFLHGPALPFWRPGA